MTYMLVRMSPPAPPTLVLMTYVLMSMSPPAPPTLVRMVSRAS